jgi:N-acetylglucosaminyldiphosphoundecaprenol N-acetyl-beta-D-mannosaminyltransferase
MSQSKDYIIAGVPVDGLTTIRALEVVTKYLVQKKPAIITTPNSEIIMQAQRNEELKNALVYSQLRLADSVGVTWAVRRLYHSRIPRLSGADFAIDLIKLADRNRLKVLLVSRSDGLDPNASELASQKLARQYPHAKFASTVFDVHDLSAAFDNIKQFRSDIILLGLGAPIQEIWSAQIANRLPQPAIIHCCGGTVDFLAGIQKRAPKTIRKIGLEWLWRLLIQPKRFLRQIKLLNFVLLIFRQKRSRKP